MSGFERMTVTEMKAVRGGACNDNYGYWFCCPASRADMLATVEYYQNNGQTTKAAKFVQFCYECCNL